MRFVLTLCFLPAVASDHRLFYLLCAWNRDVENYSISDLREDHHGEHVLQETGKLCWSHI
jgi:hypothetical protein